MRIKYTLRLTENGTEVWKRWSGDQGEALRLLAGAAEDLYLDMPRLRRFVDKVTSLVADVPNMAPGDHRGVSVLDQALTTELSFEIRSAKPKE